MRVRIPPLSIEQLRKGWTGGAAVKPARLIVEAPQRSEFFFAAKPGLRDRRFQDPDRLVIDPDRHRKGMAVLAAVGEREARRVGKPIGRAVDDLGDHRQRPHRPGADTPGQQQLGKILWAGSGRRGQGRMQPPEIDIGGSHIVITTWLVTCCSTISLCFASTATCTL